MLGEKGIVVRRLNPLGWIQERLRARKRQLARPLIITNLNRATELATALKVATTSAQRNRGLLGRDRLDSGTGLWIIPTQAVHTFFMRFAIDLVYLDRKMRVRKLVEHLGPWRVSVCWSAHSVMELPAGVIRATGTRRGDLLDFEEADEEPATASRS